jgi:hypothetical protein
LWSELQRERDRRARIALARQREERQAHEAGAAAARTMRAQLDGQVAELQTVLTSDCHGHRRDLDRPNPRNLFIDGARQEWKSCYERSFRLQS